MNCNYSFIREIHCGLTGQTEETATWASTLQGKQKRIKAVVRTHMMAPHTQIAENLVLISAFSSQKAHHSDSTLAAMRKQPTKCFANRQNLNAPFQPLGSVTHTAAGLCGHTR